MQQIYGKTFSIGFKYQLNDIYTTNYSGMRSVRMQDKRI